MISLSKHGSVRLITNDCCTGTFLNSTWGWKEQNRWQALCMNFPMENVKPLGTLGIKYNVNQR